MNPTPQEIARKATELNISGRAESLAELVAWVLRQVAAQKEVDKEKAT
ncbi:hypothetical protein [Paraburkholderia atlantica]|nr:hypothetical protein [Paraburkholderia atlantica]MBB5508131.1 hypothetical protein [Paraburkholderia atlantica]